MYGRTKSPYAELAGAHDIIIASYSWSRACFPTPIICGTIYLAIYAECVATNYCTCKLAIHGSLYTIATYR